MTTEPSNPRIPRAFVHHNGTFDQSRCRGNVAVGSFSEVQCSNPAKFYEPGRWARPIGEPDKQTGRYEYETVIEIIGWCGTHAPSKVAAREAKRQADRDAEWTARSDAWHREAIQQRIARSFEQIGRELAVATTDAEVTALRLRAQALATEEK